MRIISTFLMLMFVLSAQAVVLDRIVAKVGREIILESELDQQMRQLEQLDMLVSGVTGRDVLEQMVETRLVIQKAREQNYTVDHDQVRELAQQQIDQIRNQFPTAEAFQQELQKAGLNQADLRKMFIEMLTEERLKEQIIRNQISNRVHVTEAEVEEFYRESRDQFPMRPAMDEIGIIQRTVKISDATRSEALATMYIVMDRLHQGEDFADLAKQYSEGPAAKNGGDLGFFSRGMMIEAIEDAAFSLKPGQLSEVIETVQGIHIIKLVETSDDEVHVLHMMKKLSPGAADHEAEHVLMARVLDRLREGEPFSDMARTYSEDDSTAVNDGVLGEFPQGEYPKPFNQALQALDYGVYSDVIVLGESYFIVVKLRQVPRRAYEYLEIEQELREMVRSEKQTELYSDWIKELMKEKYVEILLEG
ncbi:MAG: peptidylprolyl isomerase [Candidatus Cloacimonetes bacterium]|nr:peptidylprolyl isomerase [Candidatus Cloacimonadota bacterium]